MDSTDKEILEKLFLIEKNLLINPEYKMLYKRHGLDEVMQATINNPHYIDEIKTEAIRILAILKDSQNN